MHLDGNLNPQKLIVLLLCLVQLNCSNPQNISPEKLKNTGIQLFILGTLQDGGLPHIGCPNDCCAAFFENPNPKHKVVSLGILDHENRKHYLFEATPDLPEQVELLQSFASEGKWNPMPDGIFLSHAHIGHYTGLMFLGKEAKGAHKVPVYAMPRMQSFLTENGPWSQLVSQQNIELKNLADRDTIYLSEELKVLPFRVPHRDEFSETVGYKIIGPNKSILFIPDIDKWEKWNRDINKEIAEVDLAFLDGTFFNAAEVKYRDISQIPHPFISESIEKFNELSSKEKSKVHFIHFNHTNALAQESSPELNELRRTGMQRAEFMQNFEL